MVTKVVIHKIAAVDGTIKYSSFHHGHHNLHHAHNQVHFSYEKWLSGAFFGCCVAYLNYFGLYVVKE